VRSFATRIGRRLALGLFCCAVGLLAQFYPYPYPQNYWILIFCTSRLHDDCDLALTDSLSSYFVASSFLQYVVDAIWEEDYVFVGEHESEGRIGVRTKLPKYDELYTLTLGERERRVARRV
jgi:hypothetical protein